MSVPDSGKNRQGSFEGELGVLSPVCVPKIEAFARFESLAPGTQVTHEGLQHLCERIHPQLSAGCNNRFRNDDESAHSLQSATHRNLFGREQCFIESACRLERFTGAKQKAAVGNTHRAKGSDKKRIEKLRPGRDLSIEP